MPVTTSVQALEKCTVRMASFGSIVRYGEVIPGNTHELSGMVNHGVRVLKPFFVIRVSMSLGCERSDLLRAMPELRAQGVPLLFHAELEADEPIDVRHHSVREYVRWLHARPREWEDRAVAMVIELVQQTGCPAHIVHLSSATALPMLRRAKQAGLPITVETCPHYLCLTAEDVPDGATQYKCAPPIRGRDNREALWKGLHDGTIDQVVTDHSPCIPSLKHLDVGDFEAAWGGIASLELGLSSVWTEARRRGFNLQHLSDA